MSCFCLCGTGCTLLFTTAAVQDYNYNIDNVKGEIL